MTSETTHGTVFIAWWEHHTGYPAYYTGYWDSVDDTHEPDFLETMPTTEDLHVALGWAKARTSRVYVRPRWNSSQPHWGGEYTDDRYPPLYPTP